MVTLFFSYSHKDEDLRNELETHLAMLKRQGVLRTWHDRRVGAGKDVDRTISEHLEKANIILLLVSPYFLGSDYCYDVEMKRALERHEAGGATVIPVILHPCDWHNAPFGRLRATPRDGQPVSKFVNMHDAFLEIVGDIRRVAHQEQRDAPAHQGHARKASASEQVPVLPEARSSNLRVRRDFTDREKDEFLEHSFAYIERFFDNSLAELQARNPGIEARFRKIDATHFTASVYVHGQKRTGCRIWLAGRESFAGGIGFSTGEASDDHSFNEALSVVDDGYSLLFKAFGLAFHGGTRDDNLTQHGGAEYLWSVFIRTLQ